MKNVLIGYQLNEIGELITHKKKWSSVDWAEKCFFAAVLFMIVFSLVATTIFTIWARGRMKQLEEMKSKTSNKEIEITMKTGSNLISSSSDSE